MVDALSYFSFQPVLHDWCNKGRGMCYPVCGMMHIKEPLLFPSNMGKNEMCSWTTQIVRGIPLPPLHGLFFVNSSKVSFTCCIPHVVRTIQIAREETCCHNIGYSFRLAARFLLYAPSHRQHSTGWNEKQLYASAMGDRSNDQSHKHPHYHEATFCACFSWNKLDKTTYIFRGPIELFLVPASAPRLV